MRLFESAARLKVVVSVLALSMLASPGGGFGPSAALAQSAGIPGFGGATEKPRMLIIFDTSRSMRFTPDESAEFPNMDYDPPGVGSTTRVCGNANQGNNFTITCPAGQTISEVEYAYYGRKDENDLACDMGTTRPTDYTNGCDLGSSVQQEGVHRGWRDFNDYAKWKCLGKTSCSFTVENDTLHNPNGTYLNPCYGTSKYGVVSVICGDDPCPPGSGSKFCLGKRAVYNIVDSAEPLIEFAVTGYFQQYWERANPEIPAGYLTQCKYDVMANAASGLWWNNGTPGTSRSNDRFDLSDLTGGTAMPNPNTNYTFSCNPESWTGATGALNGVDQWAGEPVSSTGIGLNGVCQAGQPAKTCNARWSWQNTVSTAGGAQWRGEYFTHPDPACRDTLPTLAAATTGSCTPSIPDTNTQFLNVSVEHSANVLASNYGGDCSTAPPLYHGLYNSTNRLPGPTNVDGDCSAARPCSYFRNPAGDGSARTRNDTWYRNYGPAPVTIGGYSYTAGPFTTTTDTNVNISAVGGGMVCPATFTFTGTIGGCSATNPCDTTLVSQPLPTATCPSGTWGAPSGGVCTHNLTNRHSSGLTGNLNGVNYVEQAATTSWSTHSYSIPLTTYVNNGNKCPDETASFTITSGTYQGVTVPCSTSTSVTSSTHRCEAEFVPFSATQSAEKRTDLGTAICRFRIKNVTYRAQTPSTNVYTCNYRRTNYRYERWEPTCQYRAYSFQFQRKRFEYNFQLADGDYQSSFETPTLAYPAAAPAPFCTTSPMAANEPHSDGSGFGVTSGPSCRGELAPGQDGCPANAARCKLRWGSAGNSRFSNYVAAYQLQPYGNAGPPAGCPVGDPGANNGVAPNRVGGYASIHPDWCNTSGGTPYVPPTWNPAKLVADYYHPTQSNAVGARAAWQPVYFDGVTSNPFDHAGKAFDRFYWLTEPNAVGVQTPLPAGNPVLPNKTQGLSLFAPTSGTPSWEYGVTAFRWGDNTPDPKRLLRRYDPVSNPMGLRMPEIGDMTPLAGALANAHDYVSWVRTHDTSVGGDDLAACRRYSVLLITDGLEEPAIVGVDPVAVVGNMKADNIDVYVVGFGVAGGLLDAMAQAAGTDVGGRAYDASDYTGLTTALNDVIGQQLSGYYSRSKPTFTFDGKRVYTAYFAHSGVSPNEYYGYLDAYAVENGLVASTPVWKFDDKLNAMPAESRNVYARPDGKDQLYPVKRLDSCSDPNDEITETITGNSWCDNWQRGIANEGVFWVRNDYTGAEVGRFSDGQVKKSRLTSIVHSQPAAVGVPNFSDTWATPNLGLAKEHSGFDNVKFYNSYRNFKTNTAYKYAGSSTIDLTNREGRVFVQSNGGLLHAVREDEAQTNPLTASPWLGEEAWAVSPKRMLERWRSLRDGGKYGLDGAMAISDVCFGDSDCEDTSGQKWRTVLVGAAGRGGNYLYALDVTDPDEPVWLWDFNPSSGRDKNMGETVSGPVLARVRAKNNDSYKWGVFLGGGYSSVGDEDCGGDWDDWDEDDRPIGNFVYVIDADPSERSSSSYHADLMNDYKKGDSNHDNSDHVAKYCVEPKNKVRYWDAGSSSWKETSPKNNIPMRPRVTRPNDGSRAETVYIGDTDGKMLRMDVTKDKVKDWAPKEWFNPFNTPCSGTLKSLPDHPGPDVSLPLAWPLQSEGLPELWTRSIVGVNDLGPTANGKPMVWVGSGNSRVPEKLNVQNYFYAILDNTDVSSTCDDGEMKWGVYLDKATGEKVLSEPAIIGENIIVAVYVPPNGTGCGQAGYTKLYCFKRYDGTPNACLTDTTGSPIDPAATTVSGQTRARYVRAGDGIASDLVAAGNTVLFNTSANPVPQQVAVSNIDQPFRVKSWRRVR